MVLNRQKKKALALRTFIVAVFMALFTQVAQAQTVTVFMRDGSTTIERNTGTVLFYDSHGPSNSTEWWNQWYQHDENYTYVFKPKIAGDKIKVTFHPAPCYDGNTGAELGDWALRINDDYLSVYEGNGISEATLIATLTGNTQSEFSFMTDGAMTFHFVSNSRYREEGWYATVELVTEDDGMQPQAPFLRRSICYNAVELLPTTLGAKIWYTIDGTDPCQYGILYENEIPFPASGGFTVKAVSKLSGEDDFSPVATADFTDADRIPTPGIPTITPETGTNIVKMTPADVPDGVNETYVVRYTFTTNGTDPAEPDLANSTLYTEPISCTVPGTKFKAKTFGLSCGNWVSTATASYTATTIYCPKPVISFEDMTISASESGVTYNIIYTLDGTEPSLSPEHGTTSATTVSLTNLAYGTTVKAMAYKMNGDAIDTQYQPSAVVSAIYVPTDENGNTQNGTYGNTVLLDDREDHTWSYYADKTQPIHKLNPADVKITYYGNGTKNMTSSSENDVNPTTFSKDATGVHVNIDAPENQFIYIKTLENDKEDGTGNYPYTTIPNPFQVRPTLQSGKGVEDAGQSNTNGAAMVEGTMSQSVLTSEEFIRSPRPQTTIAIETSVGNRDASVAVVSGGTASNTYVPMYNWYCDYGFTSEYIIPASYFAASSITSGTELTAITLYRSATASWTAQSLTIKLMNTTTSSYSSEAFLGSSGTTVYENSSYSSGTASSHTFTFKSPFTYTGGSLVVQISAADGGTASSSSNSSLWSGVSTSTYQGYCVYGSWSSSTLEQFIPNTTFAVSSSNPTISVSPSTVTVKTGFTTTLTATTANVDATTTVNWASSNTAVATVSANGKGTSSGVVTGVSAGTATITASMTVDGTTYSATSVVTVEDPSYCSPAPTRVDGEGITNVAFGSGSETVNNSNHPTTSPYYGDYSSLVGACQRGSTASVDITFATGYTYGTVIWVDWDNDYEFEDSEVVYTGTSGAANPTTLTATFAIPASQAVGNYRMRIGAADSYFDSFIGGNTSADHDPCYSGTSWSVFHDYTLHVTESVEAPVFSPEAGYYTSAQTVTITSATSGASIYYTLDGSTPTTSSTLYSNPLSINATTTVKAIAVKDNIVSTITSGTYTINTSGGGSMTCEDFEDYASSANTSYSTAGSLPNGWDCGALSSTTYQASYAPHLYNGSVAVDGVGIIVTAGYDGTYGGAYWIDTDITLEEGATLTFNTWVENTSYGTLSYGYFVGNNFTSMGVATTASWSGASNTDGVTTATVPSAANGYVLSFIWRYSTSTSGDNYSAIIDNICQESTGAPSAPVFSLASGDYTGTQTVTITCSTEGATIYYTTNGTTPSATNGQTITSGNSVTISSTTTLQAVAVNTYGSSAVTSATYTITQVVSSNSDYRGFYAWRLKRVSDGLTIKSKDGNTTYTTANGSNVIPAETELQFITSNTEGNEVEFEALWAQAYVVECSTNNGLSTAIASSNLNANVGYERNFVVVTGGTQTSDINNTSQKPVTITGLNPDGTGTMSSSRYLGGFFTANKNTKFENVYVQDGVASTSGYQYTYRRCIIVGNYYMYYYNGNWSYYNYNTYYLTVPTNNDPYSSYYDGGTTYPTGETATYNGNQYSVYYRFTNRSSTTLTNASAVYTANGNDLVFGRGINGTVNYVRGLKESSTYSNNVNYTIRIESGLYNYVSFYAGYNSTQGGVSAMTYCSGSANLVKATLGSDYDRAKGESGQGNDNLSVAYAVTMGNRVGLYNQDASKKTMDLTIKSGKFFTAMGDDMGTATDTQSMYLGITSYLTSTSNNQTTKTGGRYVTIEGGEMTNIAGGVDANQTGDEGISSLNLRMRGGLVKGAIYGAGAISPASGDRHLTFTGGTVKGWIGAGCNGVPATGNMTTGGQTHGEAFVYVGGKTQVGGSAAINGSDGGTVFGAGKGSGADNEPESGRMSYGTNLVIADEANILNNVYGGGNYGFAEEYTKLYVLGGTVQGNVFGGSNQNKGPVVTINMRNGNIAGNLYGGSNASGSISGLATINVSGGTVSNVFGGGYGSETDMSAGTKVEVSGGTISNNVYGGGEEGTVSVGGTSVTFSGGTVNDVFGAGKGGTTTALVSGTTEVAVGGGTVNGAVYGGGEAGNVEVEAAPLASTVTVNGGEVKGDVFGGGKMGTTAGSTIVNVKGGILRQNVFGGAYGSHGTVYVGGLKTVNMMGGRVYGSVYGGSRNANDANVLTEYSPTEKAATSITNISGGQIEQHVYAAGYYGNTYGSVYAFLGLSAINNAPNHAPTSGLEYTKNRIVINGNVWAGGDWGTFNGTFGDPTVSGNSNVYIDGQGYSTEGNDPAATNYMNIAGSILGSGTSCDAGTFERTLIVRHYGADIANTGNDADVNPVSRASRQANSIQRFHKVIFDDSHLGLIGQGKINSLNNTEKYALYEIDSAVYIANGTTLVMNAPSSQLKSFHSVTCEDTYAASPAYSVVGYNGLTTSETDNKIRVNGGSYLEVKYAADPDHIASGEKIYGELEGFSHIMTSNDSNDATCAYARPKQSNEVGNIIPTAENNANDGGFVSYLARYNQYTADGSMVAEGGQVQLRYENHTPNMRDNSEYFRIWRYGGKHHNYEGILNAEATTGGTDYKTVTVTVQLPAWTSKDSYYRFDRTGTSTLNTRIDYGSDVLTYNAACYQDPTTSDNWMYFDYEDNAQVTGVGSTNEVIAANLAAGIDDAPNLNYGLVIKPGQAMSGSNYIICSDADEYLANLDKPFTCSDNTKVPSITFTLTYSNNLTANMTWDPIVVPLVQCDKNGNITDYVNVSLVINTSTEITSGFVTQVYARMIGGTNTKEQATVNVVLPTFTVADTGEESQFTLVKAVFTPDEALNPNTGAVDANYDVSYEVKNNSTNLDINSFFLTVSAVSNPDNTDDWRFITGEQDGATGDGTAMHKDIGQAGGRSALTFGISLYYNNNISVTDQTHMGDVTFTIGFTNYEDGDPVNEHYSEFTVTVEIYRIGRGKNFYVDGVNGLDVSGEGRGKYPDLPAKTVNYIFNRLGFLPGDNIFVVDEMPIEKATTWDGSTFQNEVNIYRYPGGHNLSVETSNFDNSPYLGSLATITKELNMKGVTMDGMYAEAILPANEHNSALYPDACTFNGVADAPMIVVEDGGRLNLSTVTTLKNNYNNNNKVRGGAVNVNYGGVLAMNMASAIKDNINAQGGGVFVDGAMIVSDSIYVYDNYVNTAKTKQNNVYLAPMTQEKLDREGSFRVVQIGTSAADAYNELQRTATASYDTKIGITKEDWDNTYEGYMPVVYAESGTESFLDKPYAHPQDLIVHDGGIYSLERYVTDLHSDSPNYLYWLGTWVTAQYWNPYYESNEAEGYTPYMTAAQLNNISTPEQLAWVISLANGENGVDKTDEDYVFSTVNITNDIDMSANIWVPIGNEEGAFKGTFKGNGHVISGLKGSLNRTNLAMFGATDGATISDMVVNTNFNATATNMGTVIGTMKGGTLSNVEGAGTIINNYAEGNTGGLVGVNEAITGTAGEIHSSFAAADITGGKNIGGLVAVNNGNLINAYSNATIKGGTNVGGLVAINGGRVENCYNVTETTYPFAATNNGTITMCYAAEVELEEGEEMVYVGDGTGTLTGHGTYGTVLDRKKPGYLYNDNQVTLVSGQTNANDNVAEALSYTGGKIEKWPGLLSTLNQWVSKNAGYTSWLRPTTADINGDLPVLCFPKDNCLGTVTGRALRYSAFDDRTNGLDNLLSLFEDKTGYVFLYGNATEVENVPDEDVHVYINEDAVLLQKQQAGGTKANEANFINTTVGITFDNSDHGQNATDYFGTKLDYDWHLMSTPLADAKLGISYATGAETGYGKPADWSKVEKSYMPDMTNGSDEEEGGDTGEGGDNSEGGKEGEDPEAEEDNTVKWDFYTYFEPQYHWINFKRSAGNHWHYDEPHDNIDYTGNEQTKGNLTAGRGYMMAISQDSYLNQTGTLNNGDVKIELTLSGDQTSDTEPTKDWGSNLIGNPYQAYLDLDVVSDETGLESFYVYDADNGTYGPYMTGASVNPAIPSKYIHPHQGFFAVINDEYVNAHGENGGKDAYTPKTVNVTLSYNMATAEKLPTSYFRGERIDYPVVNIFATNEKGSRDLAIIELGRPELNGVRKIENLRNANFKLYAHYDGGNYGLLFTPIDAKRVPVHFRTMEDGQFTLTWSTYNGTFTNLTLVDNLTGVRTNMLATDHYTFNGSVDDYAARFYITFNVTGVDEIDGGSDDFAWFDGNDWIVTGQGQLEVIDVTGRVLQSRRVSGEQTRLHLDNVAAGMYMMRLTEGNRAKVQKIVVK